MIAAPQNLIFSQFVCVLKTTLYLFMIVYYAFVTLQKLYDWL